MPDIVETVIDTIAEFLHRTHVADGPPALEIDDDGWLVGDGATRTDESARRQSLAPGLEHIEGIAWHYTDTARCGAMNLADRILAAPKPGERAASWHAVIDATGAIVQSVSAKHGAWHVGSDTAALFRRTAAAPAPGSWEALVPAQRGKIPGYGGNSWLFGIELENVGEVRLVDGKWCGWPFAFGTRWGAPTVVPASDVVLDASQAARGHHAFTGAQVLAAQRVTSALVRRYGLRREACAIGHMQIDPERRTDPGPLWMGLPMPKLGEAPTSGHLAMILGATF